MKRIRTLTIALLALSVLGAFAASSAFAASTNNPQWQVNKAELSGNKEVTAEANGTQKLNVAGAFGATIACKKLKVASGAKIIGSTKPAAGTDEETIVYEECEVEGSPSCTINGEAAGKAKITTNLLKSTLVFKTKAAAEKEESSTLSLFEPKTGTVFVTLTLAGTCPATGSFEITGQVAAENVKGNEEIETHELNAPATAITKYFVNEGGKTVEKKVNALKFGIFPASYVGKAKIKLTSKEVWSVIGT